MRLKLALNDPICGGLYGPYGLEDVVRALARLQGGWDDAVARRLYYERLHNQEDLYWRGSRTGSRGRWGR